MLRASRGVLLAVTMVLLLAGPLVAQVNTGNVYGNVIDEQGGVDPGRNRDAHRTVRPA